MCCAVAQEVGVIGEPEVETIALKEEHAFFVIASDGVWEFLTSQAVVDMVTFPSAHTHASMHVKASMHAKALLLACAREHPLS